MKGDRLTISYRKPFDSLVISGVVGMSGDESVEDPSQKVTPTGIEPVFAA